MQTKFQIIILLSVSLFTLSAFAQQKRPMTFIDLLEMPSLSDPQLSPDGQQLLYVLAETDWEANRQIQHIWRVNVDGSGQAKMTSGKNGERNPRWSPDGKQMAFLTKRGDDEERQIYLLSNHGGEAKQLTDHATAVSNIQWVPDQQSSLIRTVLRRLRPGRAPSTGFRCMAKAMCAFTGRPGSAARRGKRMPPSTSIGSILPLAIFGK